MWRVLLRTARIDLDWLPLGAGSHSVRLFGRVFELLAALTEHRDRRDLYHSALAVHAPEGRFVIEMTPIRRGDGAERGVVAEGSVGMRAAGRFRLFRYEIRRCKDGTIPDIAEAVNSPIASAMTAPTPANCSSSCRTSRRPSGVATSCTPARCGTRTR